MLRLDTSGRRCAVGELAFPATRKRRCLSTASLTWNEIDRVLLVGGGTLVPMIGQRLRAVSGRVAA